MALYIFIRNLWSSYEKGDRDARMSARGISLSSFVQLLLLVAASRQRAGVTITLRGGWTSSVRDGAHPRTSGNCNCQVDSLCTFVRPFHGNSAAELFPSLTRKFLVEMQRYGGDISEMSSSGRHVRDTPRRRTWMRSIRLTIQSYRVCSLFLATKPLHNSCVLYVVHAEQIITILNVGHAYPL